MSRPIGIDLGTTYSAVSVVDENGKPRLLANEDGKYLTPSVVLFDDDGVLVGEIAKDMALASPDRAVSCVKRYMDDPDFVFEYNGKDYTPEMISAEIIKELKSVAEKTLGQVKQAVITVPAYFLDAERAATKKATELAGLEVLKIINEPTAAALSYGLNEDDSDSTILVYDFGGGTFDVTIMKARGGSSFEMITTAGNHRLGGHDWDNAILDYVADSFVDKYGEDPRDDLISFQDLSIRVEQAKIALSKLEKTRIVCQHSGKTLPVELTRKKFEELTAELLELTEVEVDLALSEASLKPGQIDMVLLVGGSTKMPMVRNLVKNKARTVKSSRNPDHCVTMGAALQAAILSSSGKSAGVGLYKPEAAKRLGGVKVLDRTPHALGVIAVDDDELVNTVVIPKNTEVPCNKSRDDYSTTYDNQDTLTVHVVQGEERDPEACVPLASYDFKGIPKRKAGAGQIRVIFKYDTDTIVDVSAVDLLSRKELVRTKCSLVDISDLKPKQEIVHCSTVLVLDCSGSMGGRPLEEMRRACHEFINNTDFDFVELGFVQFGIECTASVLHPLSKQPGDLRKSLKRISAYGSTPMGEGIEVARNMLSGVSAKGRRQMVVFTDGYPDNEHQSISAADKAKSVGILITCVGVEGADRNLLDKIASSPEDSKFAQSGEELVATFGNIARVSTKKGLK